MSARRKKNMNKKNYENNPYEGVLPSVADLEYTPLVYSKFQQLRNGYGLRFEVTGAFRIGCFQLNWQVLKDQGKERGNTTIKNVRLWLKGDSFISTLEQLRNKRIAPVVETRTDKNGAPVKVYYKKDFMGSPAKGDIKAESRAFTITDASSDRYMYTFTGKKVEGVTGAKGTISPKPGAIPTQLVVALTQEEFWELLEGAKRMWYGYTSAQWSRTVIREELQKIFSEYSKFTQKSNVAQATTAAQALQPSVQNQGIAQQQAIEPSTTAPVQQSVQEPVQQPAEQVVEQDDVIDYDDLPY